MSALENLENKPLFWKLVFLFILTNTLIIHNLTEERPLVMQELSSPKGFWEILILSRNHHSLICSVSVKVPSFVRCVLCFLSPKVYNVNAVSYTRHVLSAV